MKLLIVHSILLGTLFGLSQHAYAESIDLSWGGCVGMLQQYYYYCAGSPLNGTLAGGSGAIDVFTSACSSGKKGFLLNLAGQICWATCTPDEEPPKATTTTGNVHTVD
jgi:hypothetical protein